MPSSNRHRLLLCFFLTELPPFANLCNNMETGANSGAATLRNVDRSYAAGRRRDQFELLQELHVKLEKLEEETQAMKQSIRRCAEERAKLMDEITKQFHRIRKTGLLNNGGHGGHKKLNLQTFPALISIIKQLDDHRSHSTLLASEF